MSNLRDTLIDAVFDKLNTKFKDSGQKSYRLTDKDSPITVKRWFSTGCTPLDIAISNRIEGGIPSGRITEISGLQAAGKSLVLATTLANAQKDGAIAVMIDNEFAVDQSFYKAIGLDLDRLIYSNIEYVEDTLSAIEEIILLIRAKDKKIPIIIGIDSIAAMKTRDDLESDYDLGGYKTHLARILSSKLSRTNALAAKFDTAIIFTQQLRMNLSGFGDPYVPARGGMAIAFYSDVRIRLKRIGKIKAPNNLIVGVSIRATIDKNRLGPAFRTADFEVYFDSGIDDVKACLDILKLYGAVKGKQWSHFSEDLHLPGIEMKEEDGELISTKFQLGTWRSWMANDEFHKIVRTKISEFSIMKYKGFMESDQTKLIDESTLDD